MSKKEKKLIDLMKHVRRINYRVQDFFKYRLMVNQKTLLLVGGSNNPLTDLIQDQFKENWKIASLAQEKHRETYISTQQPIETIKTQAKEISKYYEAIIVLDDKINCSSDDLLTQHEHYQQQTKNALIASYLATQILPTNGFICFTCSEDSYFERFTTSIPKLVQECQVQHLTTILGDREDLETDTLVLQLLLKEEYNKDIVKYIKMWCDGVRRPSSGTFIQFKQSETIVYPELL